MHLDKLSDVFVQYLHFPPCIFNNFLHKPNYTQPPIFLWKTVECLLAPDKDCLKFEILRSSLASTNHRIFPGLYDWCAFREWDEVVSKSKMVHMADNKYHQHNTVYKQISLKITSQTHGTISNNYHWSRNHVLNEQIKRLVLAILYITSPQPCFHRRKNTPKTQPFNLYKHGRHEQAAKSSEDHEIKRYQISSLILGIKLAINRKLRRVTTKIWCVIISELITGIKLKVCLLWSSLLRQNRGVKVAEVNKTKAGNRCRRSTATTCFLSNSHTHMDNYLLFNGILSVV